MTLTWTKENSPRWDAGKQRLFGAAELAAVGLAATSPGEPVANEWWRVTDGEQLAGYGWLDSEWGDARITFIVAPGQRGRGVGVGLRRRSAKRVGEGNAVTGVRRLKTLFERSKCVRHNGVAHDIHIQSGRRPRGARDGKEAQG